MKKIIDRLKLDLFVKWLHKKIITVIIILSTIAIAVGFLGTNYLISNLIDNQALRQAQLSSKILREAWFTYSQNIVDRIHNVKDIKISSEYHNIPDTIPNPITYTIEIGERLTSTTNGTKLHLYSEYPFPHRQETGGPQDDFEKDALEYLKSEPFKSFYRREKVNDLTLFRYAEGIIMQTSCVACHNSVPTSPKKDWKVGDLRGVIEVNQSINDVVVLAADGAKVIQFTLVITVCLLLFSIIFVVSYLRNYNQLLRQEVLEKTAFLQQLVSIDSLTELANRRKFDETLQSEWNRVKRTKEHISLLICDVDYFKQYNDTYGHQAGDKCLQLVASAIDKEVKRSGDLAARYGGEEFAVILPYTEKLYASMIAEKIVTSVRNLKIAHEKSAVSPYVTISIGIACLVPDRNYLPEDLVKIADDALYEAKKQGRNRSVAGYFDSPDMS